VNTGQVESADSNIASKAIIAATAARTLGITINATPPPPPPPPQPPTGRLQTIATIVYDTLSSGSTYSLGREVGTIPLAIRCDTSVRIGTTDYYWVPRDLTTFTLQTRSYVNVARCARS
jgi:hypothetical protein